MSLTRTVLLALSLAAAAACGNKSSPSNTTPSTTGPDVGNPTDPSSGGMGSGSDDGSGSGSGSGSADPHAGGTATDGSLPETRHN